MNELRIQKARSALGNIRTGAMKTDPVTRREIGIYCTEIGAQLIESADAARSDKCFHGDTEK